MSAEEKLKCAGFKEQKDEDGQSCLLCNHYQVNEGNSICDLLGINFGDNFAAEAYVCRKCDSSIFDNLVEGIKRENAEAVAQEHKNNTQSSQKEGCYIATAVYGDYDAPEVLVLRKFRDNVLKKSKAGRLFIKVYYAVSPGMAQKLKNHTFINRKVKWILDQIVQDIRNKI